MRVDLPSALRAFDRRERGLVVAWALDKVGFSLGFEFRSKLGEAIGPPCAPVSADAFAAMDYEMRWLHGALATLVDEFEGAIEGDGSPAHEGSLPPLQWTNEDLDLLVAYSRGPRVELLLIEAKGYTKWDPKQVAHKVERLRSLFGEDGRRFPGVCPHLIFVGPVPPKANDPWPSWALAEGKPVFMKLPQPTGDKYRLARTSASEFRWETETVRWPGE